MTRHDWQDPEAPEGDTTEQARPTEPGADDEAEEAGELDGEDLPGEAAEGDAVEQRLGVPDDGVDDYR